MSVIDLIRLIRKHIVLLVLAPLLMAILVIVATRKPNFVFASQTTLYTGLATGSSVEMDKAFNYFATNTAFDNLINVIKSRETQQEVSIRLLSQHLMLEKPDPKYISAKSFNELRQITPAYISGLIVRSGSVTQEKGDSAALFAKKESSAALSGKGVSNPVEYNGKNESSNLFPSTLNRTDFEETVRRLTELMESSDTNFVYELLNYKHPHYSIEALAEIKAIRIGNSDLIKLNYEVDDPGICQQTLAILNEVSIKNYKNIKENRSDAVVKYFESQLSQAAARLKKAEDKLLEFNKSNNIINYYEQSKAVAVVKEDLEVEYNRKKAQLAGIQASIKRLEEKLGIQQQIQLKSSDILEKKRELGELNYLIASAETNVVAETTDDQQLNRLKEKAEKLKQEIKASISDFYRYGNTLEGLPVNTILTEWINNVIEAENIKGSLQVMSERISDFQNQYSIYAPAGANIKRIEREISVSEQEFLEILHGLNLAKLKLQDNELTSNIKAVDQPYFPLSPIPTKRKILVVAAALFGMFLVMASVFVTEYFDNTLRNPYRSYKILKIPFLGLMPKIFLNAGTVNLPFILNRLLDIILQNIVLFLNSGDTQKGVKTMVLFSTMKMEGKTVMAGNLARKLIQQGKKVVVLNYTDKAYINKETDQMGFPGFPLPDTFTESNNKQRRFSLQNKILGYPDPRINFESPFLDHPSHYLKSDQYFEYMIDANFHSVKSYSEILESNGIILSYIPDYVLIELPPLLYYPYPSEIISQADMALMICRSNRIWTDADQSVLNVLMKLSGQKIHYILNGVELLEVESVLGELPKQRSVLRRKVKNFFRFQFFSGKQF